MIPSPSSRRLAGLIAVAVLCLGAGAFFGNHLTFSRATGVDRFSIEGTVAADDAEVIAPIAGTVTALLVQPNGQVLAGQPIAILENETVRKEADLARARLSATLAALGPRGVITPAGGTVLRVQRQEGALVMSGQPILTIGDSERLRATVKTSALSALPWVGQPAWVYRSGMAPLRGMVQAVDNDEVNVSLPPGSGLHLDDPVEIRFDLGLPGDPVTMYRGCITGDVLVIRAPADGRIEHVAAMGLAVRPGEEVAHIDRAAEPDPAAQLAVAEARLAVRLAEERESKLVVRAPRAGRLSRTGCAVGEAVAEGARIALITGEGGLEDRSGHLP